MTRLLVLGTLCSTVPVLSSASILTNGSFETSTVALDTNIDGPVTETGITGWTLEVPTDARARYAGVFAASLAPSEGSAQVILGNGDEAAGSVISQTFATTPGTPYEVLFDSGFIDTANQNTGTVSLLAAVDTALGEGLAVSFDISGDAGTGGSGTYTEGFSFTFIADSASTVLSFTDTTAAAIGNGADIALDNVSVGVVPEPTSAGLLALGSAALLRKRRR